MDPISLLLLGSAALGVYAASAESRIAEPGEMLVRKLYRWDNDWLATEMSSEESLNTAGSLFDIPLAAMLWPAVKAGTKRVVILTQSGGPASRAVIASFDRQGRYGWSLDSAYRSGMRRVSGGSDFVRINELLNEVLNADPAIEVAQASQSMDPVARYNYLRHVLMANPSLSAALATNPAFKELVVDTVTSPEVVAATGRAIEVELRGEDIPFDESIVDQSLLPDVHLVPGSGPMPDPVRLSTEPLSQAETILSGQEALKQAALEGVQEVDIDAILEQQERLQRRALGEGAPVQDFDTSSIQAQQELLRQRAIGQAR